MQQKASDPRMDSMYGTDRFWAYGSVIVLWALYAFVLWAVLPHIGDDANIVYALLASGGLVLLFNTAAVVAMITNYAKDMDHIYGLDLHYLDLMRNKG